jgi:hypothetical protein
MPPPASTNAFKVFPFALASPAKITGVIKPR